MCETSIIMFGPMPIRYVIILVWISSMLCLVRTTSNSFLFSSDAETIKDYICNKKFKGYRVDYKQRSCVEEETYACTDPFPYQNMHECLHDFYGGSNVCEEYRPCQNNGICSPVIDESRKRTFKCECSNTGYFGERCEIYCPPDLSSKDPRIWPCVEI